jgi:hypothetical protein
MEEQNPINSLWDDEPFWDLTQNGKNWVRYHSQNPQVFRELRKMALDLLGRGRKKWGMKSLFEVLRWKRAFKAGPGIGQDGEEFKLANAHTPYYARYLMHCVPALEGFFDVAVSEADDMDFDRVRLWVELVRKADY